MAKAEHVLVRKNLYYPVIIGYFLLLLLVAALVQDIRNWVLAFALIHFIISWQILGNQERGGVMLFEIPISEPDTGPVFVLFGFMTMGRLPKAPQQFQHPDEPEYVYNDEDKRDLPWIKVNGVERQMVRPFRILSGGPQKEYGGHLNIRATGVVTGTTRLCIEQFFDFWVNIPGHTAEEKFTEVRRQMYDTWANTLKEEWEIRPAGLVVDEGKKISRALHKKLEIETESWGVRILEVTLRSPDFGHDLNKKLTGIGEANADAEQTRIRADAAGYARTVEGQTTADANLAKRIADADGDAYEAKALNVGGEAIFAARAAERIIGDKAQLVFGVQGIAEATAAGLGLGKIFGKDKKGEDA